VSAPRRDGVKARLVALAVAGVALTASALMIGSAVGLPLWVSASVAALAVGGLVYRLFFEKESGTQTTSPREVTMAGTALVGIIMGSESDKPVMQECADMLDRLGVPYQMVVASAHRQPERVHEWASTASDRGLRVIVAAAGKAAHLGGVVAAYTPLPVIAVPMKTSDLGGLDSLLSMVQMPTGVPVACVAINGAKNAAILATQILGASDGAYRDAIIAMKSEMAQG
jgi:5-(carboxyamino)imidazole ribonucleotide mutase